MAPCANLLCTGLFFFKGFLTLRGFDIEDDRTLGDQLDNLLRKKALFLTEGLFPTEREC